MQRCREHGDGVRLSVQVQEETWSESGPGEGNEGREGRMNCDQVPCLTSSFRLRSVQPVCVRCTRECGQRRERDASTATTICVCVNVCVSGSGRGRQPRFSGSYILSSEQNIFAASNRAFRSNQPSPSPLSGAAAATACTSAADPNARSLLLLQRQRQNSRESRGGEWRGESGRREDTHSGSMLMCSACACAGV